MTSTFNTVKSRLSPTHLTSTSPPPLPVKHWSQTSHETILIANENTRFIQLPLAGGADNGEFIYFIDSISILKNKTSTSILKGGKIDIEEIILEIDQHRITGYTLTDVQILLETLSTNGKQIRLKTVKAGLTKDLRQFLDGRFEKGSIDHDLQQTIRDNLYMRTVPCTTRPPRPGEINGQDYTFLSVKDFRALEKNSNLLESGVYKGHYYGTPRPTKGVILPNTNLVRRSNSANEMFQHYDPEYFNDQKTNEPLSSHLPGEMITSSLRKSSNGFGFTIVAGYQKGEEFLQIKDILPDGQAAKDGKLQRGDILVYINDSNVFGYSHTDVVKIFQALSIGDLVHLTVCRGYPLTVNFDDPQIDVVSVNGVHHLPNGGYREHQSETHSRIYVIKIRKGENGFGFTIADSPSGQRVKAVVDKQRCQNLCENDLLMAINGEDLSRREHLDVVGILKNCSRDVETTFVIRRGDPDASHNSNGNNRFERNLQSKNRSIITGKHVSFLTNNKENKENDEIDTRYLPSKITEKPRTKTPTSFASPPLTNTLPLHSRTPLPATTNNHNNFPLSNINETSAPLAQTELSPDSVYTFDRQIALTRSARERGPTNGPLPRSKTPGPEFDGTKSASYRSSTMKPRSKTPTAYEFAPNTLHNSRSLQSVHPPYSEIVVDLTLLRANDGFGLRILGGEEEKSQVSIGHIIPNSPAAIDARLYIGDEIIKIDGHSTIRASHERVVQLMQRAKENQHVSLIVRRYVNPNQKSSSYRQINHDIHSIHHEEPQIKSSIDDDNIRFVTLQKSSENQSFGFVIISSQNKTGGAVDIDRENDQEQMENSQFYNVWIGKIIPHSPADQCGQLHVNDRILAVNGIDLSHMLHIDVVNLIKESGRMIRLTIAPPIRYVENNRSMENANPSNGIRPSSSSSPMVVPNGNNQTLRNAFSQNPLNASEKNQNRPPSRANGILKSSSLANDYFIVDLQRPSIDSSFGFSIRGGREFSISLFILKVAENGPAAHEGQMKSGDQIIEINGRATYGMTHSGAISLIREGGLYVRLLLRKTNAPPPSLDEVKSAMGSGMESISTQWKPSGYT